MTVWGPAAFVAAEASRSVIDSLVLGLRTRMRIARDTSKESQIASVSMISGSPRRRLRAASSQKSASGAIELLHTKYNFRAISGLSEYRSNEDGTYLGPGSTAKGNPWHGTKAAGKGRAARTGA